MNDLANAKRGEFQWMKACSTAQRNLIAMLEVGLQRIEYVPSRGIAID
ncbi:hypothetical protein [Paraburkholderia sp. ZP32-5]|nr:hypothetical protein [Paraburkholderia sp. ZP32-5]